MNEPKTLKEAVDKVQAAYDALDAAMCDVELLYAIHRTIDEDQSEVNEHMERVYWMMESLREVPDNWDHKFPSY